MNEPIELNITMDRLPTEAELKDLGQHKLYTLFMSDFLKMPEMDFQNVSHNDPDIRALLN